MTTIDLSTVLEILKKLRKEYNSQLHQSDLKQIDDLIDALEKAQHKSDKDEISLLANKSLNMISKVLQAAKVVAALWDLFDKS